MSTLPQIGDIRFGGDDVRVFYVAICDACDMALPFESKSARAMWIVGHPHVARVAVDVRPAPGTTPVMRGSTACLNN